MATISPDGFDVSRREATTDLREGNSAHEYPRLEVPLIAA